MCIRDRYEPVQGQWSVWAGTGPVVSMSRYRASGQYEPVLGQWSVWDGTGQWSVWAGTGLVVSMSRCLASSQYEQVLGQWSVWAGTGPVVSEPVQGQWSIWASTGLVVNMSRYWASTQHMSACLQEWLVHQWCLLEWLVHYYMMFTGMTCTLLHDHFWRTWDQMSILTLLSVAAKTAINECQVDMRLTHSIV